MYNRDDAARAIAELHASPVKVVVACTGGWRWFAQSVVGSAGRFEYGSRYDVSVFS